MKALLVDQPGGEYRLVDDVEKPTPGKGQVLVKSLVTAMNPVEGIMQGMGVLVTAWPIVFGCDASGTVVEVGEGVSKFKVGDGIFGCTTLGVPGHSTFQEYHLMNEHLAFKKPKGISTEDAATIGVGLLTAGLGLISGTKLEFKSASVTESSPWIVVLGAAGSVGQFAIQIAKIAGHKVIAACSPSNDELVKSIGADATFDYKLSLDEQISTIEKVTGGNFLRIFDASANAAELAMTALSLNKLTEAKYFATTNDWSPIEEKKGVEVYKVTLGEIGRSGNAHSEEVSKDVAKLIPEFEKLIEAGQLKPQEYVQIGNVGVGEVLKALEAFKTHKSGKKVIVRLAAE